MRIFSPGGGKNDRQFSQSTSQEMVIAVGPPCKASDAEREGREGIAGGVFLLQGTVICGLKATPQAAVPWEEACTSRSPSFCSLTIQPSDCISSPRRNTAAPGHAGDRSAHWHTAQLSPQTRHASHISHIRGHHHMQSGCMCLVFKREKQRYRRACYAQCSPSGLNLWHTAAMLLGRGKECFIRCRHIRHGLYSSIQSWKR